MFRFPALALGFLGRARARLKTRASAGLAIAVAASVVSMLSLAPASPALASGPTSLGVSGWQVYSDLNIFANPLYVGPYGYYVHGDPREYAAAPAIPAQNDPGWANCGPSSPWRSSPYGSGPLCPNASTVGMAVGSILPGCWSGLNFTYFQALVGIPEGTTISQFSVNMRGADDGARVSLVNSQYPNGVTPLNGYIYSLTSQSTGNLAPYVVAGEVNRVVITQVDDCAVGNNLNSAQISLNGTVIPPAPADTTPPTITLSPASGETAAPSGWYNAASSGTAGVAVVVSATDAATGVTNVTCTDGATQVLNMAAATGFFGLSDGVHHVVCTATDGAHNTGAGPGSTIMPVTYQIDQTAPNIAPNASHDVCAQPGSNGWCRGTETAAFTASDPTPGSGLANPGQASFTQSTTQNGSGVTIASGQVCDVAGNCNAGITAGPFKIDSVAPTQPTFSFSPDGGHDWFQTSPATGTVSATDATSGVASYACTDSLNELTLSADGALSVAGDGVHQISCTATDEAGNVSAAGTTTVKIDTTPPTMSANLPDTVIVSNLTNAMTPTAATVIVSDATSGVASVSVTGAQAQAEVNQDGSWTETLTLDPSVGTHQITITATDNAGNTSQPQTYTYTVWDVVGPFAPVVKNGNGTGQFRGGSTIPVKFQLTDGTHLVTTATGTASIGTASAPFAWDATDQQYQGDVQTARSATPGTYDVVLHLDGIGQVSIATVSLR